MATAPKKVGAEEVAALTNAAPQSLAVQDIMSKVEALSSLCHSALLAAAGKGTKAAEHGEENEEEGKGGAPLHIVSSASLPPIHVAKIRSGHPSSAKHAATLASEQLAFDMDALMAIASQDEFRQQSHEREEEPRSAGGGKKATAPLDALSIAASASDAVPQQHRPSLLLGHSPSSDGSRGKASPKKGGGGGAPAGIGKGVGALHSAGSRAGGGGLTANAGLRTEALSLAAGVTLSAAETASYGQCISAACYLIIESILVRTQSDRLSLFLRNDAGQLCLVANAGQGTQPVLKEAPVSTAGIVRHVFSTRIAANLERADLEDVSECRGPTVACNTLVFPIQSVANVGGAAHIFGSDTTNSSGSHANGEPFGVIQLVNKRKGLVRYTQGDELLLHHVGPSIACILERYPTRLPSFMFDATPLHRWAPLPAYQPPTIDLLPSLTAEPTQLVFSRREDGQRYTRKQWMANAREVNTTTAAATLEDLVHRLEVMEDCWRASIADNMHLERLVEQKEHHMKDARDIILRKQRKIDLMKNVLCDEIARHLKGESALTWTAGRV